MKRVGIVLLVFFTVLTGPLFAADQQLRVGMWARAANLFDISTPGELQYVVKPYVEYTYGRQSTGSLTGGTYLSIIKPYEIGTELDAIRPSVESWLNYRFKEDQSCLMQTGLTLYSSQNDAAGTYVVMNTYFNWYPYNQAKEVTVHQRFPDLIDGLRLGVGINGGVLVGQLLEDANVTTDLHGGITGILASGAKLGDHFWAQGHVQLGFPNLTMPSSFDTYTLSAASLLHASLSYVSDDLYMTTAITANILADKLLTQDGFFDDSSFEYYHMMFAELGYFITDNLVLYGGVELSGNKSSLFDYSTAFIGAQYFLL